MPRPFVTIMIPCRNEEKYIGICLDSIIAQDYPSERMEILVADGMSTDNTRKVLEAYTARDARVRWFENLGKSQTCALNLLIGKSAGEIIVRMDAHSSVPENYVSNCVKYLIEYGVDNVGGVWKTLPGADTATAQAIALALTSLFGVGGSRFRLGVKNPTMVETVPFGCYRREIFSRIGLFNEKLVRNEDNEFNTRLIKAGGKILLHPNIKSSYRARPDLWSVARQHFLNGFWCTYGLRFSERPFFLRHLVPMGFVCFLVFSLTFGIWMRVFLCAGLAVAGFYICCVIGASSMLAFRHRVGYFLYFLVIFPLLHFSYGVGSLCGVIALLTPGKK